MIDKIKKFIYQIEINTIASSMGFFSDGLKKFYSHFSKRYPEYYEQYNQDSIPLNKENVIDNIVEGIISAIRLFSPENYQKTYVVFIVQDKETNVFDQKAIENGLWDK
jgi:hypothetical protein